VLVGDLGTEAVHAIVVAADAHEGRGVDRGARDLRGLEVLRHQDDGLQARGGGTGGHRVGQVAGGGAAHRVHAELLGLGEGDGHEPVLEGERGMTGRVVLEPEIADAEALREPGGRNEGREAGAAPDRGRAVDGEELTVSPEVGGPGSDGFLGEGGADGVHVVDGLERRPAVFARRDRVLAPLLAAALAP
jgi:hypothetical protein